MADNWGGLIAPLTPLAPKVSSALIREALAHEVTAPID